VYNSDINKCPECGGDIIMDGNERLCEECGLVVEEDYIDRGPEWRAFDSKEQQNKSRVGSPIKNTMHDKGLTTTIDWKNRDHYGNNLSSSKREQMRRLRKWQSRIKTKNSKERNLKFALSELDRMVSSLDLSEDIQAIAAQIYRDALDKDLIRGRSIEGVVSGCLYAACRLNDNPRSLSEIEMVSRVDEEEIGKSYRYIKSELGLKIPVSDPKQYVPRFCSKLDLSTDVENTANEIIDKSIDAGLLSGKSPTGFAAAAIYLASTIENEKRTQEEVAKVSGVTAVTIRNRYQEQTDILDN
jgi:transcription initiation factor TFIIB